MIERREYTFSELRTTRDLFPAGKIGVGLYRKALQIRGPEQITELRREFGEGKAGAQAFLIIAASSSCEAKSEEKQCDRVAVFTIDFNVFGECEHIPVCSKEHGQLVRQMVARDLNKSDFDPTFGINGRGRA